MSDYSTSFTVQQSAEEVYAAILNVNAWWTGEIEGQTDKVGAEFAYRHLPQHYSLQRVTELKPGRRVAWQVVDSKLAFVSEPSEWTGSQIVFDITPVADGSSHTHVDTTAHGENGSTPEHMGTTASGVNDGGPEHVGAIGRGLDRVFAMGTGLRFTHVGLLPEVECFGACSTAWQHYINGSLHSLITTGEGLPDPW